MKNMCLFGSAFVALVFTTSIQAGTFWFPLEGYYPYTTEVTAVPDLDQRIGYMRSRMNETGKKSNGCVADTSYLCTDSYKKNYSIWSYLKDGGGNWEFDGVYYTGDELYLWYDNHLGYDFIAKSDTAVRTVEVGTFCGLVRTYGQVCVQHLTSDGANKIAYKTYYTHMANIPSSISKMTIGQKIAKWTKIGTVSNVGTVGKHLHFSVYKYDPNHINYSSRKVTSDGWIIVDPYGIKAGLGGKNLEQYLWN
jgi:murein DD-endopeptidase MepM/ murein hydrolase activator NlpD